MLYAETLRHFVQEWIEIEVPSDISFWPWDPKSRLFMINLYAISSDDTLYKMPKPFISILVNGLEYEQPWMITDEDALYRNYFTKGVFKLPRRYLLDPFNQGEKSLKVSRYSFMSDAYDKRASDWSLEDLRLCRLMADRNHIRRSVYDSEEYALIINRLEAIHEATGHLIDHADNLYDITTDVQDEKAGIETMLIAAPITGLLYPVKKSKKYRLMNGALIVCQDDVRITIGEEPCAEEYLKLLTPYRHIKAIQLGGMSHANTTKTIVYICTETPTGTFTFQEFSPGHNIKTMRFGKEYGRVINHHFTVVPDFVKNRKGEGVEVRLSHQIHEGVVPYHKNTRFLWRKRNEPLFVRRDLPDGVVRHPDGSITRMMYPSP